MTADRLPVVDLIDAKLIYDYRPGSVTIPQQLWPKDCQTRDEAFAKIGKAKQFQGADPECLAEIAGRACYDSFGKGRTSGAFHAHILEVGHGSVYEHFNFTVEVEVPNSSVLSQVLMVVVNRPNLWVRVVEPNVLRLTLNMRHVVEWHFWTQQADTLGSGTREVANALGTLIRVMVSETLAPRIAILNHHDEDRDDLDISIRRVEPETDEEKWITMLLTGSRGFSHELVRHGDRTAISQRSTRYVDENESPWVWHPLIHEWIGDTVANFYSEEEAWAELGLNVEDECKKTYGKIVDRLQPWLLEKLEAAGTVDPRFLKTTARKQARGAARGFLGNALYTEVVFSASVAQWNRILRQRAGGPADAEIRESFAEKVLPVLRKTQYADSFAQWESFDCEDGIGQAAREV